MKRFEKFVQRQIKSLIKHLKKYKNNRDPEALHQIRVDIKKIKAALQVIKNGKKGFKAHKNFIPFRKIFRRADNIREPDVLMQMLKRYQPGEITDDRIFGSRKHSAKAFESDIPYFIWTVKSHAKKLEALSNKVRSDDLRKYLQGKKQELKSLLYPRPRMRIIHEVRKAVKEIIYLSEVQDTLKGKEAKFYDKVQDTIGQLHDKQVLLGIIKNKKDETSITQREAIKSESLSDKKEIFRLVREYYGHSLKERQRRNA
jgi:CHAD domain-containing protein